MKGTATFRKARFTNDPRVSTPEFDNNRHRVKEKFPTKMRRKGLSQEQLEEYIIKSGKKAVPVKQQKMPKNANSILKKQSVFGR